MLKRCLLCGLLGYRMLDNALPRLPNSGRFCLCMCNGRSGRHGYMG